MRETPRQRAPVGCLRSYVVGEELPSPIELRPAPDHAEHGSFHWIQPPAGSPVVNQWHIDQRWLSCGVGAGGSPRHFALLGYRYLGPAEWVEHDYMMPALAEERLQGMIEAQARIAAIEAENASLKAAIEHKRQLLAESHRQNQDLIRQINAASQAVMSDSWQLTAMHPDGTRRRLAYGDLGRCEAVASNPLAMKGWTQARIEPMPAADRATEDRKLAQILQTRVADPFPLRALRGGDGKLR